MRHVKHVSITVKDNNKIVECRITITFQKISLLQIPESYNIDQQSERMSCSTSIMKYRRHPSKAIQDAYDGCSFSLSTVEKVSVIREIKNYSNSEESDSG